LEVLDAIAVARIDEPAEMMIGRLDLHHHVVELRLWHAAGGGDALRQDRWRVGLNLREREQRRASGVPAGGVLGVAAVGSDRR
jgi:hypothetical protein